MAPQKEQKVLLQQMAVFSQYGRLMLAIQLFEVQLIGAAMLASAKDPLASPQRVNVKRGIKKVVKRAIHLNFKATATEARNSAAKVLPADLMEDVDRAIKWRNRLAHRYLREKIADTQNGEFAPGTYGELVKLTDSFDRLGKRLARENERIGSSWPEDTSAPPEIATVLENAMRAILKGGPPPQQSREAA
jgi:hypothetical protein